MHMEIILIDNDSNLYQIVDCSFSRRYVEHDLGIKKWGNQKQFSKRKVVEIVDNICKKHYRVKKVGLITFKSVVEYLNQLVKYPERLRFNHFYAESGLNILEDCKILIVVGTPRVNESAVWDLALAVYPDYFRNHQLEKSSFGSLTLGNAKIQTYRYNDPKLRQILDYLIRSELSQAIGRSRWIKGGKTVYVLSNYPLPLSQIIRKNSIELGLSKRRQVLTKIDERYLKQASWSIKKQGYFSNREVTKKIGLNRTQGHYHLNRIKLILEKNGERVEQVERGKFKIKKIQP